MSLIATVGLLQLAIPVALLLWLWLDPESSRLSWVLKTLMTLAYMIAVAVAGVWGIAPFQVPYVFVLLALALATLSYRTRPQAQWPKTLRQWALPGAYAAGLALSLYLLAGAFAGYRPPAGDAVDLGFPMRDGTFIVINGGNSEAINAHLMTLTNPRFHDFRGQSYAVDILQLNSLGMRARGLQPEKLDAYAIFDTPVYAPCSGNVVQTENKAPDMTPPERDRGHMAGNYVLIECRGARVLLGHLRQGSVQVTTGPISEGTFLGNVGNSGNTDEPHLHIHAQRVGSERAFLDGDPLPITFGGDYLVRNERVRME